MNPTDCPASPPLLSSTGADPGRAFCASVAECDPVWWATIDSLLELASTPYVRRVRLLFGLLDEVVDYPAWKVKASTTELQRRYLELYAHAVKVSPGWQHDVVPFLADLVAADKLREVDRVRLQDRLLAIRCPGQS